MSNFLNPIGQVQAVINNENIIADAIVLTDQQRSQQEFVKNLFHSTPQNLQSINPSLIQKDPEPIYLSKCCENVSNCFGIFQFCNPYSLERSGTKENDINQTINSAPEAMTDSSESSKSAPKATTKSPDKPETSKRESITEIPKAMVDSSIKPKTLEVESLNAAPELINKMEIRSGFVRKETKDSEQIFLKNLEMSCERLEGLVMLKRNEERSIMSKMLYSGDLTTIKQKLRYQSGLNFLPANDMQIYELKKTLNNISVSELSKIQEDYLEAYKIVSQMNDTFENAKTNLELANAYIDNIENYSAALMKCVLDYANEKFRNADKGGMLLFSTAFQRVPRHVMLLKELIKNCLEEDKPYLNKALEKVEAKSVEINAILTS